MLSISDSPPWPACPAPFNMAAHVLQHCDRLPDKIALRLVAPGAADTLADLTFAALKAAVLGTGTGLLQAGLVPGDTVLMRLGNTPDFPVAYLAALAVGLVPVPTSAALTEPEVARIIAELSPRLILRDPDVTSAPGVPELSPDALRNLRTLPPADWHMGDPDRLATSSIPLAHPAARAAWPMRIGRSGRGK